MKLRPQGCRIFSFDFVFTSTSDVETEALLSTEASSVVVNTLKVSVVIVSLQIVCAGAGPQLRKTHHCSNI